MVPTDQIYIPNMYIWYEHYLNEARIFMVSVKEFSLFYTTVNIARKTGLSYKILLLRVMEMASRWLIPFVLTHAESFKRKSLALISSVPIFTGRVGSRSDPAPASGEHRAGEPAEETRELFQYIRRGVQPQPAVGPPRSHGCRVSPSFF